jgi:hypothetical protein
MSIKVGFSILVLIVCTGVFILPAVAATFGITYQMYTGKLQGNKVNHTPIDFSYLVMPFGFTPHVENIECDDNGNCYDANSIACGSCGTDPFIRINKSPWLAWAQVAYQPPVLDPNAPLIRGTQFELSRHDFIRQHDYYSELV